jgi:hypothetical protein
MKTLAQRLGDDIKILSQAIDELYSAEGKVVLAEAGVKDREAREHIEQAFTHLVNLKGSLGQARLILVQQLRDERACNGD